MHEPRTLDEILALYQLEPSLKDVYVEGESDRRFLSWFLGQSSRTQVEVYTIDVVDIPEPVLKKYGLLKHSRRSKVLALAAELGSQFKAGLSVVCVADRDFQDYLPIGFTSPMLQFTDGNSLECYALTEQNLRKFSLVVLGQRDAMLVGLSSAIANILRQIYVIRLANEVLGWGMEAIPFTRYVRLDGTKVSFEEDKFLRAYLQKNNRWHDREEFKNALDSVSAKMSHETERTARGHDIAELLFHLIHKLAPSSKFSDSDTLEGALLGTIESRDLEKTTLFQRLLSL